MGDRIAVMSAGVLQQVAPPQDLYDRPANTFVAGFLGQPRDEPHRPATRVESGDADGRVRSGSAPAARSRSRPTWLGGAPRGDPTSCVGVRPEALRLEPHGTHRGHR